MSTCFSTLQMLSSKLSKKKATPVCLTYYYIKLNSMLLRSNFLKRQTNFSRSAAHRLQRRTDCFRSHGNRNKAAGADRFEVTHCDVTGQKCDQCQPGYWNLVSGDGCEPCQCHPLGSDDAGKCDEDTGVCTCLPGVGGDKCDSCLDNHYGMDGNGCKCLFKNIFYLDRQP